MRKIKLYIALLLLTITNQIQAQTTNNETNFMTKDGKIMVVMSIVVTIVIGLFIYLITIDKKISDLEKKST